MELSKDEKIGTENSRSGHATDMFHPMQRFNGHLVDKVAVAYVPHWFDGFHQKGLRVLNFHLILQLFSLLERLMTRPFIVCLLSKSD